MTQSAAELIPLEAQTLITQQDPEQLLVFAKRCADTLMKVYEKKKKKVVMNGRNYLEHEDWTVLARFFGVTARTKSGSVRFVEYGEAQGFECEAEAIKVIDGVPTVLSIADSMCLDDEENWGDRPRYEWVDVKKDGQTVYEPNPNKPGSQRAKREKKQVGVEPTPLFQLRSMAQTRAQAKVMRQMLSWVVVLAQMDGFSTTPAEEMSGSNIEDGGEEKGEIKQPVRKEKPQGTAISEKQRKRLFAIARDAGFNAEERIKQVIESHGFEHADEVTTSLYEVICKEVTDATWKPQAAAAAPKQEAPKAAATSPKVVPLETTVQEVIGPKKDNKGDYIVLRCYGVEVYCRKVEQFPILAASVSLPVKFNVTQFGDGKYILVAILQVGDKEWMEDGTPVIRREKIEPEPAAAQAPPPVSGQAGVFEDEKK